MDNNNAKKAYDQLKSYSAKGDEVFDEMTRDELEAYVKSLESPGFDQTMLQFLKQDVAKAVEQNEKFSGVDNATKANDTCVAIAALASQIPLDNVYNFNKRSLSLRVACEAVGGSAEAAIDQMDQGLKDEMKRGVLGYKDMVHTDPKLLSESAEAVVEDVLSKK